MTDVITKKSLDWLRNERDPNKPFLLMVHHKAPHRPWDPASEKLAAFEKATYPEPATFFDDYATRGRAAKEATMRMDDLNPTIDLKFWGARPTATASGSTGKCCPTNESSGKSTSIRAWKSSTRPIRKAATAPAGTISNILRDYLACISSVDDSVGQLLDYLDQAGLAENTIVVYASDQGFYLGEHSWFDKRFMYEQSLRTPLVIRWPGMVQPGTVDNHIVSNLDFAETFLDAAGIAPPRPCKAAASCRSYAGSRPPTGARPSTITTTKASNTTITSPATKASPTATPS